MTRTLTIFHVTDVHARVGSTPRTLPGMRGLMRPDRGVEIHAGLAGIDVLLQDEMARLGPDTATLLVCCGDLVGTEMATDRHTRGGITFEALELLRTRSGVDAAVLVVGNHEVDHGVDRARELLDASSFVVVAGNVDLDGAPVSDGIVDVDVAGLRVGVLGLTTIQTATEAPSPDRPRIDARKPVAAAREALSDTAPRDALVAAVHLFDEQDLAIASLDGVDLVLGGHTHAQKSGPLGPRRVHREKAGSHGLALGRAVLRIEGRRCRIDPRETALLPPDLAPPPDSPFQALHDATLKAVRDANPAGAVAVARATWEIGSLDGLRTGEASPLGRTVAQGLLDGAAELSDEPVHAGIINAGNIRADLVPERGVLPLAALHDTLAFANELVLVELSPTQVLRVLRTAIANLKLDRAGWLHTAGLVWNVGARGQLGDVFVRVPRGHRAAMAVPLHDLAVVRIATIDWLAEGGHHLDVLTRGDTRRTGLKAADAWAESLRVRRLGDRLAPLVAPPPMSSVDGGFRCTDTREVLETLDQADPGGFAWAHDALARSRS